MFPWTLFLLGAGVSAGGQQRGGLGRPVGVLLAFLDIAIWVAMLVIGLTTFALSFVGVVMGHRLGRRFQRPCRNDWRHHPDPHWRSDRGQPPGTALIPYLYGSRRGSCHVPAGGGGRPDDIRRDVGSRSLGVLR